MPNDILMFHKSGFAIAMGNGGPEVQEAADAVTASCDDKGFAKAVEEFILGPDRADASRFNHRRGGGRRRARPARRADERAPGGLRPKRLNGLLATYGNRSH